jgi:disulfide bond formation protein DsbB
MPAYVETVNQLLSFGTIILQVLCVFILVNLLFFRRDRNTILLFLKKYGISFAFLIAFFSMALSLFYSEIVGFPPCELCIIERCFIYPQVFFFGLFLWKRSKWILPVVVSLAFFGMLVSGYHVYVENGGESGLSCVTDSISTVSCSARYVYEYGFVTIPVMALTAQVLMLLLGINYWYISKKEKQALA